MRSDPPEPKGKLNTMTGYSWSTPAVGTVPVVVNGPEDVVLDWDVVDWRRHEGNVGRLRQRIFKATQEGDLATVRNLQKLMLRSWSNTPGQRAAGDAAQRLPQDGRGQWAGRVDLPGQD